MPDRLSHLSVLRTGSCSIVILLTVLLTVLLTDFVHSTLVVVPRDTEVTNGSNTQLNCSTSLSTPIHWQHIPLGSTLPTDIYLYKTIVNSYVGRFQVQVDTGSYNLVITDIQFEDAGIFRCLDNQGEGEQKDAKLMVTENKELKLEPSSAEVQVGANFQFTCKTYYKDEAITWQHIPMGNILPVDVYMQDQLLNGYETRYEVQKEMEAGINKLIIKSAELRDSGIFRCIDKSGYGQQVDSQLRVVGPLNCHSSVNASCELVGIENVNLTCSVNFSGKTSPTIEWKHEGGKMESATSIFPSDKVVSYLTIHIEQGSSYLLPYSCLSIASNSTCTIIIQQDCTVSGEATGTPKTDPVKSGGKIIAAIVVPIVVGVVIGIIITFVIIRCRNKNAKEHIGGKKQGRDGDKDASQELVQKDTRSADPTSVDP